MHNRTRASTVERRDYPCWAVVEPAPDIKGKWVAHCLEFDTLAQADDPETAVRLLVEGTNDIVLEDLRAGVDPLGRRAPQKDEHWEILRYVADKPEQKFFNTFKDLENTLSAAGQPLEAIVITAQFFLGYERSASTARLTSSEQSPLALQVRPRRVEAFAI